MILWIQGYWVAKRDSSWLSILGGCSCSFKSLTGWRHNDVTMGKIDQPYHQTQQLSPDCYNLVDPSDLRTIPITTRHIKITSKAARTDSYVLTRLETIIHPTHFHLETEQCHLHILSQVDHTCLFIDISNTVCLFSSTNALFLIGSKRICYRAHLSYAQHVCHQSPSFSKGNISLTPWCCVSTYLFSKRCLCVSCAIERSLVLCNVCEERQIETGRK